MSEFVCVCIHVCMCLCNYVIIGAHGQWSNYGGARGGLAPLVVLMAPLVQLIFRGSGRDFAAFGGPFYGPLRAAKRPP